MNKKNRRVRVDTSDDNDLHKNALDLLLFHAEQRYEQYRHLDNIRERYFSIWLGLSTILIGGTLYAYFAANSPSPETLHKIGYAYIVLWILGELFTWMGIQIRSTQIREAVFLEEMRNEVIRKLGAGSDFYAKLVRLMTLSGLSTRLEIWNCSSSTVILIFTFGEISAAMLIIAFYLLFNIPILGGVLLLCVILVGQFFGIRQRLLRLDARLRSDLSSAKEKMRAEPFDLDKVLEAMRKHHDTN